MLKISMVAVSIMGFSLATMPGAADARDGRTSAKRGAAVYASPARNRSVRTTRGRTPVRTAQRSELYDNTKYWHGNTPLDGKAMFDAINDLSSSGDD